MADNPVEETPAEAVERLRKEVRELRRLRAQLPMLILKPYVEDALDHIKEVAAKLTVKAEIPASEAISVLRSEASETTKPPAPETPPETLPMIGTRVLDPTTGMRSVVVGLRPGIRRSPKEWEIILLTEDGRLITAKPEAVVPETVAPGPGPSPEAKPKLSPGSRVRDKPTGKTGFVSEIAEDKAIVALDEGGFITRPLTDLEPLTT